MRWILHRGNRYGPGTCENNPEEILQALKDGFEVEIDLWIRDGIYWLGHDQPNYKVEESFLENAGLWIHCKDGQTLEYMLRHKANLHFFYHTTEDYVLTSKNYIWCYVGKPLLCGSVAVMPEKSADVYTWDMIEKLNCLVCTDYLPLTLHHHLKSKK